MGQLIIERPKRRKALYIRTEATRDKPALIFPLMGVDRSQLDELVRAILAKGGVTEESEVQQVIDKAEQDYEVRLKVSEAKAEIKRLMKIKAEGGKLMQVGFRKWQQAFYPAVTEFSK